MVWISTRLTITVHSTIEVELYATNEYTKKAYTSYITRLTLSTYGNTKTNQNIQWKCSFGEIVSNSDK